MKRIVSRMALERHGGPYLCSLQVKEIGCPLNLGIGREGLQALESQDQAAAKWPRKSSERIVHGQARDSLDVSLVGNVIDQALDRTQARRGGNIVH
ncbi:hypothetical protein [Microvirga sp. TS319]|uniref:hypothetical protein n=1 Tax=Microvirga sp. TS319 TaxID=3241165 RepID=UPI00351A0654